MVSMPRARYSSIRAVTVAGEVGRIAADDELGSGRIHPARLCPDAGQSGIADSWVLQTIPPPCFARHRMESIPQPG